MITFEILARLLRQAGPAIAYKNKKQNDSKGDWWTCGMVSAAEENI